MNSTSVKKSHDRGLRTASKVGGAFDLAPRVATAAAKFASSNMLAVLCTAGALALLKPSTATGRRSAKYFKNFSLSSPLPADIFKPASPWTLNVILSFFSLASLSIFVIILAFVLMSSEELALAEVTSA